MRQLIAVIAALLLAASAYSQETCAADEVEQIEDRLAVVEAEIAAAETYLEALKQINPDDVAAMRERTRPAELYIAGLFEERNELSRRLYLCTQ